jgi:glyoxylase-like metal-dependent hydrolase (beta-lactamase superfamily II)
MRRQASRGLFSALCLFMVTAFPLPAQEQPTAAPIPPTGRGPAIDQTKGYLVQEISDGLYWVGDGAYQCIFLTTGQGVIVVDAPPTIGDKLLSAIREVTSEPITHLVYSHSHVDHIGAAGMLPSGLTIVAHEATAEQLRRANDPRRPVPTVTFTDNYLLQVGRQRLELSYFGPAHEPGNIYIYAPSQRVLMLVDVVFPGWVPFKELALAEDVPAFVQAHDDILKFDFDTFVGGHVTRLGTRQDVEIQKRYIMDVRDNALQALQTVDFVAVGQRVGFENPWLLFDTYLSEVARVCAEQTVPNWVDRLAGADVFTRSHCAVFADSLRID